MGLIEASPPEAVWRQKTSSSFTPPPPPAEATQKKKNRERAVLFVFVREREIGRRVMSGH